jgi:type IV secretory pathway VirB2 component (pilin)
LAAILSRPKKCSQIFSEIIVVIILKGNIMKKQAILAIILTCLMNIANAQWQHGAVWAIAASGDNIFAGTASKGVFLSSDNGSTWAARNSGLSNTIVNAITVYRGNIFAGTNGGIFLSSNNDTSWTDSGLKNVIVMAIAACDSNIFAGTGGSGVFYSSDSGKSWTSINNGLTNLNIATLTLNGDSIYTGTFDGGVFYSSNKGGNWSNIGLKTNSVFAIALIGNQIFAGTYNHGVYMSANNGVSWTKLNNSFSNLTVNCFAFSGSILFAGSYGKGVYYTLNNGIDWQPIKAGSANLDGHCLATSGNNICIGTEGGAFVHPISVITALPTGANSYEGNILAYPNPVNNILRIKSVGINNFNESTISFYNIEGQKLLEQKINKDMTEIDVSKLTKGIYILKQNDRNCLQVVKLVKE